MGEGMMVDGCAAFTLAHLAASTLHGKNGMDRSPREAGREQTHRTEGWTRAALAMLTFMNTRSFSERSQVYTLEYTQDV